jgi:hypothetical protein
VHAGRSAGGWARYLIGGLHLSVGEGREEAYPFGFCPGGPWAASRPGPKWLPEAFFPFLFYFIFFFSCSIFYFFITFAFWFQIKSNQLVKFSKFKMSMQDSKGQILMIKPVFKKTLLI